MASPIRRRLPRQRWEQPRIELNVLKLDADGNSIHDDDDLDPNICHCFPETSSLHIPTMLYDHINCPHHETRHIQPAQEQVFAYPWTAHTQLGKKRTNIKKYPDQETLLAAPLGVIEEEGQYKPNVTRTAPPFADQFHMPIRRIMPPFTAPVQSEWETHDLNLRRGGSVPSLTGFHKPPSPMEDFQPSTPYLQRDINRRPSTFDAPQGRQFDGHYIDPKDGQVYEFKVNYGTKKVDANRKLRHTAN